MVVSLADDLWRVAGAESRRMDEYESIDGNPPQRVVDQLVLKGKGILDLCLERGSNLCMKGFIDCQIERAGGYLQIVDAMDVHIMSRLHEEKSKVPRTLLLDLHEYVRQRQLDLSTD